MTLLLRDEPSLEKSTRLLEMSVGERSDCLSKAMADFVEVSLLDVRERNWMAFMLDTRTYKFPNFARDQFTSDALRVNLVSRNVKRNMLSIKRAISYFAYM